VVLSPDAMSSDWVNDEIDIAWRQKNSPARMRLFPVLYRSCEVRADLKSLQMISFVPPKSYEAALEELLQALGLTKSRSISKATPESTLTPQKTKGEWLWEGMLHSNEQQYQQAIVDYDHVLQLDPQYVDAYISRGQAYFSLKQYQQAIADFDRALQLDSQNIIARSERAEARKAMEREDLRKFLG